MTNQLPRTLARLDRPNARHHVSTGRHRDEPRGEQADTVHVRNMTCHLFLEGNGAELMHVVTDYKLV